MEYILERVLPHFAEYPIVLLVLYVLTLFYPRRASYFYGTLLGFLVLYGLWHFNAQFEKSLHQWLTTSQSGVWFYSFFNADVSEEARYEAELAFTAGVYFMIKAGIIVTLLGAPLAAKTRVKEAIGNIGRRPAKDSPPTI